MLKKIQHPKTGKWHKSSSVIGSKLIKNYSKQLNHVGGVICRALKPSHGIVYLKAVNDEYLMLRSHILIYATNPLGNIRALQSISAAELDLNKALREWYLHQRPAPGRLQGNSARGISAARVEMLELYGITKKNAFALHAELTQLRQRARQQQHADLERPTYELDQAEFTTPGLGTTPTEVAAAISPAEIALTLESGFGNPYRD